MSTMTSKNAPVTNRRFPIILQIAAVLFIIVLIVFAITLPSHTNPPIAQEPNWDSAQSRDLAQAACFDCHSNETKWPWYSYVPPFSVAIANDVQEGREVLNFSDWEHVSGEARNGGELAEAISEGEMPPTQYLQMHPEARLTSAQKRLLIDGLRATVKQSGGSSGGDEAESEGEEDEDSD